MIERQPFGLLFPISFLTLPYLSAQRYASDCDLGQTLEISGQVLQGFLHINEAFAFRFDLY